MSKVVHPYAHRLVILRDWKSRWFATDKKYVNNLHVDVVIREYLDKRLRGSYLSSVEIERGQKALRIILRTSRPGMIIGRSGEGAVKLKADLVKELKRAKLDVTDDIKLEIAEVPSPDADAKIVSYMIAEGLEKRLPYRRVMKQLIEKVMAVRGVQGVKFYLGGRLGGAEISRSEVLKRGSIPLQTFRADIDFARERANLAYGVIGIKVWIYKGQVFDKEEKK
ncbi:MAG: 30S ribosomal protein S3 [Candidatus Pacebacteria bacterium]|jgi:small subunit ribosomal protein S3|nr:30S ribosomal protein S3 [Candidatus Paceibacterota bacterium]MBP9700978.1 30S ribosomal protein S3 [Candidatus Paceibacterota bacterium]